MPSSAVWGILLCFRSLLFKRVAGRGVLERIDGDLLEKRVLAHTVSDVDEFRSERCVIHKALAFTPGDLLASHPLVPLSVLGFGLWARWECWMPPCRCDGHAKALRNLGLKMG